MAFTDTDLIARTLINADQNAFSELVRRYQSPIRSFLAKMTRGDAHTADDLAQETFVKAWKGLDRYRGEGKFSTWLFGIAFNEFRMLARRRQELAIDDLPEAPPEPEESPGADRSNLRMDLAEAMKALTPAENAAIILCCQNGLSHDEAAQVLSCPLGTVKTNVLRGKDKLRRRLAL